MSIEKNRIAELESLLAKEKEQHAEALKKIKHQKKKGNILSSEEIVSTAKNYFVPIVFNKIVFGFQIPLAAKLTEEIVSEVVDLDATAVALRIKVDETAKKMQTLKNYLNKAGGEMTTMQCNFYLKNV